MVNVIQMNDIAPSYRAQPKTFRYVRLPRHSIYRQLFLISPIQQLFEFMFCSQIIIEDIIWNKSQDEPKPFWKRRQLLCSIRTRNYHHHPLQRKFFSRDELQCRLCPHSGRWTLQHLRWPSKAVSLFARRTSMVFGSNICINENVHRFWSIRSFLKFLWT